MPQQQPQKPLSLQEHKQNAIGALFLLLVPALFGLVFLRRGFGIDAVAPKRFLTGTLVFWVWHDIGGLLGHWRAPGFFEGSFAWLYFKVALGVAAWRIFEAWRAFRRREDRHTYFLGVPYLALLGVPFRLAIFLDTAILFAMGYFLSRYDVALGAWLMWGSAGALGVTVVSLQQEVRDTRDMMNAGLYARIVQSRRARPAASGQPVPNPVDADESGDEVLSTGARQ